MAAGLDDYDRVAIVSGSDSGIGEAIAVTLARDGFDLGITWHADEDGARHTADLVVDAGRKAVVVQLDLARLPAAVEVLDEVPEERVASAFW